MNDELIHSALSFREVHASHYADIVYQERLQVMVCTARQSYIPIEHFKALFNAAIGTVAQCETRHFIFDKRALTTFHQPTMEWYFTEWKPEVKKKGILHHYKILPKLDWFAKSVEAGKHAIYEKHGREFTAGISIHYKDSLMDALNHIEYIPMD